MIDWNQTMVVLSLGYIGLGILWLAALVILSGLGAFEWSLIHCFTLGAVVPLALGLVILGLHIWVNIRDTGRRPRGM